MTGRLQVGQLEPQIRPPLDGHDVVYLSRGRAVAMCPDPADEPIPNQRLHPGTVICVPVIVVAALLPSAASPIGPASAVLRALQLRRQLRHRFTDVRAPRESWA